jgi:hypothetical protein
MRYSKVFYDFEHLQRFYGTLGPARSKNAVFLAFFQQSLWFLSDVNLSLRLTSTYIPKISEVYRPIGIDP